ncbi:MAG: TPM domain-containing protein [Hyphomicrobiales bacterium]
MQPFKILWVICFAMLAHTANAAPDFPTLTGRVVDEVGIIAGDVKLRIIDKLAAFEAKSTAQIVVATVSSLEDYEIRDYGYQLARHWALGQKDVNNGVLLLIAPHERKVSIEVGYGLEGALTDALSFQIIQNDILPLFKAGNMSAGIEAGVDMILQGVAGEISVQPALSQGEPEIDTIQIIFLIFFFGVVIFIIIQGIRNPGSVTFGSGGGRSSGSSWGGSSGGFSGGGGSFGGGGASGGW